MNILLATSEAVPFAKTGGLADVCGALPVELARLGHRPAVILPAYRQTRYCGQPIEPLGIDFIVPIGSKMVTGHLLRSTLPGGDVPVYLVQQDQYFDRDQLYSVDGKDYIDNCERFVFFSRAVLEAIRLLDLQRRRDPRQRLADGPDSGLLEDRISQPAALPADRQLVHDPQHLLPGPVLALGHAVDRPGLEVFQLAPDGVPRQAEPVEDGHGVRRLDQHGQPALCPGNPEQPAGLRPGRRAAVSARRALGHSQRHRPARVESGHRSAPGRRTTTSTSFSQGKPICKAALQKELGLPQEPDVPLVGLVGRLTDQKGFDLVADVMQRWVQTSDVQWAILGTGQPKYHKLLETLAAALPAEGGRAAGVLQSAGPSHRGRRRHLPHAQPLRALRAEPALQPAVRHGAGGPRHRRAGRHDRRLRRADRRIRAGQRFQFPGVQLAGLERNACARPATSIASPRSGAG